MTTTKKLLALICISTHLNAFAAAPDLRYQTPTPAVPRTVNYCAAMLSQPGVVRASVEELQTRIRALAARANQMFKGKERMEVIRAPYTMSTELMRVRDQHFALKQILVGEQAIRENFAGVAADAHALDQAYDPDQARTPFPSRRHTLAHAARALMMTAVTGAFYTGSVWMSQHDHKYAMVALSLASAVTLFNFVFPPLVALAHQAVNNVIYKHETVGPPLEMARAGRTCDACGPKFAERVLAALGEGGDLRRPISTRYAVALPMSLSMEPMSYAERAAPTVEQITAALRTSGDFGLPKDYRKLIVTELYYYDEAEAQPVVVRSIVEPRRWTAWRR